MSLINDALKRASQSDRNRPRQTGTHASMEPVAAGRERSSSLLLGIAVVLALGLAGWFFGQWWRVSHPPAPANAQPAPAVAPIPAPSPVVRQAVPPPAAIPAKPPMAAPKPAPAPPPKPVVAAWPADVKLMGIFYNKTNPQALMNGKTVSVGDEIDGIRVTKIDHDRVTLEWNGQVKVLVIE